MKQARLERERRTLRVMVGMYCRGHHPPAGACCGECRRLLAYALQRIDRCPYQDGKPACAQCRIHCYKPAMRERVRRVMRYAGPRMMLRHPVLALSHHVDGMAKTLKPR